jgi:hypothetical protein
MHDPKKKHNKSTTCWHFITLYLLFILCNGMMINWFNPIHMAKAYEWEYKLCFDWFHLSFSTTPLIVVRMQQEWNALQLWQWVVNFTPRPFYCQGRRPQYPLNRWLGWASELIWTFWRGAESLAPAGIWTLDHLSCTPVTGLTSWERDIGGTGLWVNSLWLNQLMLMLNTIIWTFASDHDRVRCSFSLKYLMHSNAANLEVPQLE